MAGKVIVPFNETSSTFAHEGEPSPANLTLAAMDIDQEAEHIAKTPLAVIPALASEGTPGGAKGGSFEPLVRPNPLDTVHRQEDLRQERQVPGCWRFYTADHGHASAKGRLQAPFRRSASA